MKRLLCCFLMLGAVCVVKAQDTLTPLLVREVYDFQVGDVFQYIHETESFKGGLSIREYRYSQVTILEKKQIKDTIYYTKEIKEKKHQDPTIESYIQKDTITSLDSIIFAILQWPLPNSADKTKYKTRNLTLYDPNSYGGGIYCINKIGLAIPISGPTLSYSKRFMNGLGLIEWTYDEGYYPPEGIGIGYDNYLNYYKKGSKIYGVPMDFIVSSKDELEEDGNIFIYPNPTSNQVTIKGLDEVSSKSYSYAIYDFNGSLLQAAILESYRINLKSLLPSGVYLIHFFETKTNKNIKTITIIIN